MKEQKAEWYLHILEASPIPTLVIDSRHLVTHWNKACEEMTGFSAARLVGTTDHWKPFYSNPRPLLADLIVDGADQAAYDELYGDQVRRSPLIAGAFEVENFYPRMGGQGKWLLFTAAPLRDLQGCITGAVETFQDMTAHRMTENLLDEKNRHLEKVNQALKAALDHRETEKRAVEDHLTHSLKKVIQPYIEELKKLRLAAEARSCVDILDMNIRDLVSSYGKSTFARYLDLTPAEIKVADMIRAGKTTKEIAAVAGISPSSVKWHRKNIREKFNLKNQKTNLQTFLRSMAR